MKRLCVSAAIMSCVVWVYGCGGGGAGGIPAPPATPSTFSIGVTVTGLSGAGLRLGIDGEALAVANDGVARFATRQRTGARYDVIVLKQPVMPAQFCAVENGTGTIEGRDIANVVVSCDDNTLARNAYALNFAGESISVYNIDATTGQLRNRGYAKTGLGPAVLAHDAVGKFTFVLNSGVGTGPPASIESSSIAVFARDDRTGDLREVDGSPFVTSFGAAGARGLTVHRSGKFVYVPADGVVFQWAVGDDGTLSPIGAGFVLAGRTPVDLIFDDAGRFAYLTHNERDSDGLYVFEIDRDTGALQERTSLRQVYANRDLRRSSLALHPNGKFLYALNQPFDAIAGSIAAFGIDASSGALTAVSGQPFALPVTATSAPMFHPSGKSIYVLATEFVAAFGVDASTGALTTLAGSPYPTGVGSGSASLAPSGEFLFVGNQGAAGGANGSISAFKIEASTGALSALAGVSDVPMIPFATRVDPGSRRLYVADVRSDLIHAFAIDANGVLSPIPDGATIRAGDDPVLIEPFAAPRHATPPVFTPTFAYVADPGSSSLAAFAIDRASGALTSSGTTASGGVGVRAVASSRTGRFVYSIQSTGSVSAFVADRASGALTPVAQSLVTGGTPVAIAIDPSDRFVYVLNSSDASVSSYGVDSASGQLRALDAPTATIAQPLSMVIDSSGRTLYVMSFARVQAFAIDVRTGALRAVSATDLRTTQATHIALAPDGRFLYVVSPDRSIETYRIDARSGRLGDMQAIATERPAVAVDIDPSGRYMYATDWVSRSISLFTLDRRQGTPTLLGASALPRDPTRVSVDASGRFLYATLIDGTLASFSIDGATGAPAPLPGSRPMIGTPLALTTIVTVADVN